MAAARERDAAANLPSPLSPEESAAAGASVKAAGNGDKAALAKVTEMATKMYGATQGEFKSTVGAVTATEHGGVHIEVQITDKSGKVVGKTTREWVVPEGAKTDQLSVRQGALEAEPWVPAGGLSRQMNAQAYAAYRAMGVLDVHVDAKGAVGSAGWAMAGYDFSTKGELDGVVRQFRKAAQGMADGPTKARIQALIARSTPESWKLGDHPSPLEFAMAGADVPVTRATKAGRQVQTWPGRDIMGTTAWKGRHNPARPAMAAAAGPAEPPAPDAPAAPSDREAFLADVADADIGWAKAAADQVPAIPGLYDDPDYAEHHHLFTAPPEVSDQYRKMMAAVMAKHGRTDAAPAAPDAEALVAHAGCDEYCRNPLHPGPCRGWRRQIDVDPADRRDKSPDAPSVPAKKTAPAKKAAPAKRAPAKKATPSATRWLEEIPTMAAPPADPLSVSPGTNPRWNMQYGPTYPAAGRRGEMWTAAMGPAPRAGYEVNCSNVIHAFEMRARGYDVTAAPSPFLNNSGRAVGRTPGDLMDQLRRCYRMPDGSRIPQERLPYGGPHGTFYQQLQRAQREWPEGARGYAVVPGHVFNLVIVNGRAECVEAQSNEPQYVTARYRRSRQGQTTWIVRLDDLELAPGIVDTIVY